MTNAEKFEKVFGIKIDESLAGACIIIDHQKCIDASDCTHCIAHKF